jgi:hypothetical protein
MRYQAVIGILICCLLQSVWGQEYEEVRFPAPEAFQGVAVDDTYFYAIDNEQIGKYEKTTGNKVATWRADDQHRLIHMNSGVVVDGKLYCAHSTWPNHPWASSIEVFDCESMTHVESISLGLRDGALNWLDYYNGDWWAVFVHYEHDVPRHHPEYVGRTSLVRMNKDWQPIEGWLFPPSLLARFRPASNSGGSWGADGVLYCSGHDHAELYQLELPKTGSYLNWVGSVPAAIEGQAFAWDRTETGVLYGILRATREVVRMEYSAK